MSFPSFFAQETYNVSTTTNPYYEGLKTWWQTVTEETTDTKLQSLQDSNWVAPSWMNGDFFTSGPSQFDMGKVHLGSAADGFGRWNRFEIENGEVHFTSKMLNSKWLKLCQDSNDIEPNLLFEETIPARMRSKIPGMNMYYASKYGDNIFIQMSTLPDKKTYIATTDQAIPLTMNPETLEQEGMLKWEDDLACVMGITHPKTLKDGTMISYCQNKAMKNTINVFKINPKTPLKRELIGSFETKYLAYGHSFGLTEDHVIILEQPIVFDFLGMTAGKPMMQDLLLKKDETTKIHVMKLADGTYQTFDTGIFSVNMHTGNSYVDTDGNLVLESQAYENSEIDPFAIVDFDKLNDINKVTQTKVGAKFRKYSMNLEKGTIDLIEHMSIENGNLDLPMYNQKYDGVKNCYTYLTSMWQPEVIDEHYGFYIYKYDSCKGKVAGKWAQDTTVVQEANFVANPHGRNEDDGYILTQTYNFMTKKSALTVINPVTMKTVQEYASPFAIPVGIHSAYFPKSVSDIM